MATAEPGGSHCAFYPEQQDDEDGTKRHVIPAEQPSNLVPDVDIGRDILAQIEQTTRELLHR